MRVLSRGTCTVMPLSLGYLLSGYLLLGCLVLSGAERLLDSRVSVVAFPRSELLERGGSQHVLL